MMPDRNLEQVHRDGFTREDIRISCSNITYKCFDDFSCDWNHFADSIGSGLYWQNRYWMRRLRVALREGKLETFLAGFSLEEAFRALYDLRVEHQDAARVARDPNAVANLTKAIAH